MRQITRAFDDLITASLQRAGFDQVRHGQLVVLQLVENGTQDPSQITKQLGTTQQWVSKCLHILLGEGCVEMICPPGDRRRRQFATTDRGLRALAVSRAWSEGVAPAESTALHDALQALLADIRHQADAHDVVR